MLCVFLQMTVSVHANIMQRSNGQPLSQPELSRPKGNYTGERLKLLRPHAYRRVVELLAEPREHVSMGRQAAVSQSRWSKFQGFRHKYKAES